MSTTSRPKNPNIGHAPMRKNTIPTMKLTRLMSAIMIRKPLGGSERWG